MFTSLLLAISAMAAILCFSNSSFSSAPFAASVVFKVFLWSSSWLSTSSLRTHFYQQIHSINPSIHPYFSKWHLIYRRTAISGTTTKDTTQKRTPQPYLSKLHKRRWSALSPDITPKLVFSQALQRWKDHSQGHSKFTQMSANLLRLKWHVTQSGAQCEVMQTVSSQRLFYPLQFPLLDHVLHISPQHGDLGVVQQKNAILHRYGTQQLDFGTRRRVQTRTQKKEHDQVMTNTKTLKLERKF